MEKKAIHLHLNKGDTRELGLTIYGSSQMAETLKREYKERIGEDFEVETGSVAIEINAHVVADEIADLIEPLNKKIAERVKRSTSVIDIGLEEVDNNRKYWDRIDTTINNSIDFYESLPESIIKLSTVFL